jgi:membrane dipeptidase
MRKLWIAGAIVGVIVLAVFGLLPGYVEGSMNRVRRPGPYPVSERTRRLMKRIVVADLHADSLLWGRDLNLRGTRGHVDVPRLIESGVGLQAFTIVTQSPRGLNFERNDARASDSITLLGILQRWPANTWYSHADRATYQTREFVRTVEESKGKLIPIRSRIDLERYLELRANRTDVTAGFLGVEGAHALDGHLENVDVFFDAGIRMMSFTHFFDTDMAGAAAGIRKGGLTEKGRLLVRRMEEKRMLVDVAHASEAAIDDILAMSRAPVVSSHTGVKGTCNNSRNLSDRQIQGIARTGGVVAIAYFEQAVCGTDVQAVARAIKYAVGVAGIDHVALGSDFDGAVEVPFDTTGVGMVLDALFDAGFTEDQVTRIAGSNAVRVLGAALPDQ